MELIERITPYLIVAGSSAAIYVFLVVAIRLFGKKEFSQLSIFDIVFILLISNAVQNSMIAANFTFVGGVVSAITLFIINYVFKNLIYKIPKLSEWVQGHPVMLIYEGKLLHDNMSKARVSVAELEEATREHGIKSLDDVNLAVLELDGSISIVSNDYKNLLKKKKRRYSNEV
ncbi:MAG: DUF421 domain-containing protein [Oscillospiraceae bacterium]|nr:DUF421 domain-containing protein [Oscillospiraceae bacterium]